MGHLVAVVGPTGIGKSRLAVHLAQTFNGEIVGADSRQVYRYMDIGTAKPTRSELALVPHHLIDIVDPDEDFSLAQYQQLALQAIEETQQHSRLPVLVGGSGLYVWSVLEGWRIPPVAPDLEFRHNLEARVAAAGKEVLYHELEQVDPMTAQRIDSRNVRRVIRALEVFRDGRTGAADMCHKQAPSFDAVIIGLTADRWELYRRVDLRVEDMIKRGLIEETRKLLDRGYHFNMPAMSGVGYKQIGMVLRGTLTLEEAIRQIKAETHRLVRHQYNWFRLTDKRIQWFDIQGEVDAQVVAHVKKLISNR